MKYFQVPGVRVGSASAKIKADDKPDMALIVFDKAVSTAGVFTKNLFAAAPVQVAKKHMKKARKRTSAWLINSGNANCATGPRGLATAKSSCEHAANLLNLKTHQVLPFSTGPIMEKISLGKLKTGTDLAYKNLRNSGWSQAAKAIMTTDSVPKGASVQIKGSGGPITITAIAKGAGMIHPDMATMLSFITTDINLSSAELAKLLKKSCDESFNKISVDGDTSTNDSVVLAATGIAATSTKATIQRFGDALTQLCQDLSSQIVNDGEGMTCTAKVVVTGFGTTQNCKKIAESIGCSTLVKTMMYGRDPSMGRLLMAIGKAGIEFNPKKIKLRFNGATVYEKGARHPLFNQQLALDCINNPPYLIEVSDNRPKQSNYDLTFMDLSEEYVRVNAEF